MVSIRNRAYKKWLIIEGKGKPALILDVFVKALNAKHKLAWEILNEEKPFNGKDWNNDETKTREKCQRAVEMIIKQCKS